MDIFGCNHKNTTHYHYNQSKNCVNGNKSCENLLWNEISFTLYHLIIYIGEGYYKVWNGFEKNYMFKMTFLTL